MTDVQTLHEASEKLRQLSFKALANGLELNSRSTLSEAEGILREHYFYQLADRLGKIGKKKVVVG